MAGTYRPTTAIAGRPGASTWWEYRVHLDHTEAYVDHPCPATRCAKPVCYGAPLSCYSVTEDRTDYFSWTDRLRTPCSTGRRTPRRSMTVTSIVRSYWWDAPTAQWYSIRPASPPHRLEGGGRHRCGDLEPGRDQLRRHLPGELRRHRRHPDRHPRPVVRVRRVVRGLLGHRCLPGHHGPAPVRDRGVRPGRAPAATQRGAHGGVRGQL